MRLPIPGTNYIIRQDPSREKKKKKMHTKGLSDDSYRVINNKQGMLRHWGISKPGNYYQEEINLLEPSESWNLAEKLLIGAEVEEEYRCCQRFEAWREDVGKKCPDLFFSCFPNTCKFLPLSIVQCNWEGSPDDASQGTEKSKERQKRGLEISER